MFDQRAPVGVRGRVQRDDVRERARRARGRPRARPTRSRAKPPTRLCSARARCGAWAATTSTGSPVATRSPSSPATPTARVPRRAGARSSRGSAPLGASPAGLGASAEVAVELRGHARRATRARRSRRSARRRGLGAAQDQARLDGAVVAVGLEAHGGVDRLAGRGREASCRRRSATQRERAPPAASENATWRPSPIGRGSSSSAAGTSSETAGLPEPKGLSRSSSSASSSRSVSPGATASTRSVGDEVGRGERAGGVGDERRAEALDAVARDREAGGGAVAAVAQQLVGAGLEAGEQVEAGDRAARARALVAVERDQHGRAVVALGDARGDDADHARVPALAGEHVARGRRARSARPAAPRPRSGCASRRRGARS